MSRTWSILVVRASAGLTLVLVGALALCALPVPGALALAATTRVAPARTASAVLAAATAPGWLKVTDPPVADARAVATFGDAGVAVIGTGATKIALSTDGGATWTLRPLPSGGSPVVAIAFSDALHGWAVGPAGTIDVTSNGGVTWKRAVVNGTFAAVAAARSGSPLICAIDPSSAPTIVSATSATSPVWTPEATALTPYPTAPSIVASAGGFAAAIGSNGVLITRASDGTWTAQASPYGAGSAAVLTVAPSPVPGNGVPDLFAIDATDVQGSDDLGASFQSLAPPAGASLTSGAYLGAPQPQLLVGGASGRLARYLLTSGTWATDKGALTGTILSCAAGPGGVAYALSSGGHLERTMSYGAEPFDLTASSGTVQIGSAVRFTASSSVRAPGSLVLQAQPVGGAWATVHTWPWSTSPATPAAVSVKPTSTTHYRLGFLLGSQTNAVSGTVTVAMQPKIISSRAVYKLHVGDVYRLTGHVYPALPGAKVTVWTDRGGQWHRVADGGVVALVGGSSFATRLFGTPLRQGYHLQVRLGATSAHLAAVSLSVRVTIR